jgi:hypothetical protein
MIVGATLPSALVGEGLETTQPRHFASVIAKGSLGASPCENGLRFWCCPIPRWAQLL